MSETMSLRLRKRSQFIDFRQFSLQTPLKGAFWPREIAVAQVVMGGHFLWELAAHRNRSATVEP
jgi:hypothetical protein